MGKDSEIRKTADAAKFRESQNMIQKDSKRFKKNLDRSRKFQNDLERLEKILRYSEFRKESNR